jgi:peptide/nickel transport system substrate-binding protein
MQPQWNLVDILRDADPVTRREFMKRASLTGLAMTAMGALLAACGSDAPATPGAAQAATPTTGAGVVPTIAIQPTPTPGGAAGGAATAAPAAAPTTAPQVGARRGGTLILVGHQEIASLSPDDSGPTVHYVIVANIHSSLLVVDENYTVQTDLAESFAPSPDGLKYTFKLRRGVKWHDGAPFTSKDVKYTYEFFANPQNAAILGPLFRDVASVDTPDDFTAVVNMKTPNAAFLVNAATVLIVPQHYHSRIGEKEYKKAPIGTGPFKLKEWRPTEYTIIEANPDYYKGRPNLDAIRENVVPEASVRAIALDTGEADSSVWPLSPEDNLRLMADRRFQHFRAPGTAVNHFPINNQKFGDKRVRQAMLHAINRDSLVKDLLRGLAIKATANLSPAVQAFYNPDVTQYPYDPERAKALLTEAGWIPGPDGVRVKDGQRLSLVCNVIIGDALRRSEAELVQRDFKQVGIDMRLQDLEVAAVLANARKGEYDLALFNWTYGTAEPDASTTLRGGAQNNFSKFENARVDQLLDEGLREVDPAKRKSIYGEIQKIVAEEVPFLFIMFWETVLLFNNRVKGLPKAATNPYAIYTTNVEKFSKE